MEHVALLQEALHLIGRTLEEAMVHTEGIMPGVPLRVTPKGWAAPEMWPSVSFGATSNILPGWVVS